jgi:hypothetical protein
MTKQQNLQQKQDRGYDRDGDRHDRRDNITQWC